MRRIVVARPAGDYVCASGSRHRLLIPFRLVRTRPQVSDPPPPLLADVPRDLAVVIKACLTKDPRDRPELAAEVARRLLELDETGRDLLVLTDVIQAHPVALAQLQPVVGAELLPPSVGSRRDPSRAHWRSHRT